MIIITIADEVVQIKQTNECDNIENPEKLIRRFYQGDNSRQAEGSGLGLSRIDKFFIIICSIINFIIRN